TRPALHSFPTRRSSDLSCQHAKVEADAPPGRVGEVRHRRHVLTGAVSFIHLFAMRKDECHLFWSRPARSLGAEALSLPSGHDDRSEEHTSELQSPCNLV